MRILKRLFAATLALVTTVSLALGFTACGGETTTYTEAPPAPEYTAISEDVLNTEYKTYYFDAESGNDENRGTSELAPKKSLSEIAEIIGDVGDRYPIRILLKRGTTFHYNLKLTGYTATEERPFILDAYGDGDEYPVIYGSGTKTTFTNVLHLEEGNTRILNIEITGPECARGIYIFPRKGGIYENIVIDGCYVHNVNWNWIYDADPDDTNPDTIDPEVVTPSKSVNRYRRLYGGICIFTGDPTNSLGAPVTIRNIWINNNDVEEVSHLGINFYNYWVNRPGVGYGYNKYVDDTTAHNDYETGVGYFPYENVVVKGNYTNCVGGDGIVVAGADNVWMEYNTSYKSNYLGRGGFWNGGIWMHNTRNCWFQYNEAGYTYLRHGSSDGEGFDIDNTCENVHVQYNYSHHNEGGGILVCNLQTTMLKFNPDGTPITDRVQNYWGNWKNNYIRNNVFVNNGNPNNKNKSAFLTVARMTNNLVLENNIVVIRGDIAGQHIIDCEDSVLSDGHVYRNNIFYCPDANANPVFDVGNLRKPLFENNLYYNVDSGDELVGELVLTADEKGIFDVDPQIGTLDNYCGFEKAYTFAPQNQALYEMGLTVATALKYDMKGNVAKGKAYLGAFAVMP